LPLKPSVGYLKHNFLLGRWGESQAAKFLVKKGYRILRQNLRLGHSELDLVALDPQTQELVIVEVKTRSRQSSLAGHPSLSVKGKKWLALERAGIQLLATWNFSKGLRFDIISLSEIGLEHFQNVTWN